MSDLEKIKTDIALLKKDAKTGELIHQRLEVAVDKLTEITISLKGMIAQQEQKLTRAEQTDDDIFVTLESRRKEWDTDLKDLHSRITTNTKDIMSAAAAQHTEQNKEIQKIKDELQARVGVLEKWRHVLIGGSIIIGLSMSNPDNPIFKMF